MNASLLFLATPTSMTTTPSSWSFRGCFALGCSFSLGLDAIIIITQCSLRTTHALAFVIVFLALLILLVLFIFVLLIFLVFLIFFALLLAIFGLFVFLVLLQLLVLLMAFRIFVLIIVVLLVLALAAINFVLAGFCDLNSGSQAQDLWSSHFVQGKQNLGA